MAYPIFHSAYTAAQIEASIGKNPRISADTGNWEVWNISTSAWVDTGVAADAQAILSDAEQVVSDAEDALAALNSVWILGSANAITDGTDYNTLTTPGVYRVASASAAQGMIHCPVSIAHRLVVQRLYSSATLSQIVIGGGQMWHREYTTEWEYWRLMVSQRELATVQSDIAEISVEKEVSCLTRTSGMNSTSNGVTRASYGMAVKLTGTASASRTLVLWNGQNASMTTSSGFAQTLPAGTYKVRVKTYGKLSRNYVRVTTSTFLNADSVTDGSTVTYASPIMIGWPMNNGDAYGSGSEYTLVDVDFIRTDLVPKPDPRDPYWIRTMKASYAPTVVEVPDPDNPGQTAERSYPHRAFPDCCYFNGDFVIVSRVSQSHYPPADPADWGGILMTVYDRNGTLKLERLLTAADFPAQGTDAALQGELGEAHIGVTKSGSALLMVGWTSYGTSSHDCFVARLSKNYSITAYKVNPVTGGVLLCGNPLTTPDGKLLTCGYHAGTSYVVRSTEALSTTNLASLDFEKIEVIDSEEGTDTNECDVGYCGDKLFMLCRNQTSRDSSILLATDDLEGGNSSTDWATVKAYTRTEDGSNTIIHSPRLLPRCPTADYLYFCGANYRSASVRNSVVGMIDLRDASDYDVNIGIIADDLNYGGYTGMAYAGGDKFDVVWYKEGYVPKDPASAIVSGLYCTRIDAKKAIPQSVWFS